MANSWFPLALAASVGGSFALWFSMTDYERARYFGLIATVPVTVFAVAGMIGLATGAPQKTRHRVVKKSRARSVARIVRR